MNSSVKTALLIAATAAIVGTGVYFLANRKKEEQPVRSAGAPYTATDVRSTALASATAALQNAPPAAAVPAPTTPAAASAAAPAPKQPPNNPLQQLTDIGKGIGDFVQSASGAFTQVKGFLDGLHLFGG